jgi:hypothetical protein
VTILRRIVTSEEVNSRAATMNSPANTVPVSSMAPPRASGPTKPPRLATALIHAMPLAAAAPVRNIEGSDQKGP